MPPLNQTRLGSVTLGEISSGPHKSLRRGDEPTPTGAGFEDEAGDLLAALAKDLLERLDVIKAGHKDFFLGAFSEARGIHGGKPRLSTRYPFERKGIGPMPTPSHLEHDIAPGKVAGKHHRVHRG